MDVRGGRVRDDDGGEEGEEGFICCSGGFGFHVCEEGLGGEAGGGEEEGEGFGVGLCGGGGGEVHLSEKGGEGCGEEFLEGFGVRIYSAFAFSRDGDFDVLAEHGLVFGYHADVCGAFSKNYGPEFGAAVGVAGFFEHFYCDAVPAVCFFEGEFAVQFEVEGVVLAHFYVFVF